MSLRLYEESTISSIANAIRQKYSLASSFTIGEMADIIEAFPGSILLSDMVCDHNGVFYPPSGYTYSGVTVNVPSVSVLPLTVSKNGRYVANNNNGFNPVTVHIPTVQTRSLYASEVFEYLAEDGCAFSKVTVSVPFITSVPATFSWNGTYSVSGDELWNPVTISIDNNQADGLVRRGGIKFYYGSITRVRHYAFCYCYNLSSVSLPNCSIIESFAFNYCSALNNIYIPVCEEIQSGAFSGLSFIVSVNLPACTTLGWSVFNGCVNLEHVYAPNLMRIGLGAFGHCSKLTSITVNSRMSTIATNAFYYCTALTYFEHPNVRNIASSAFQGCPLSAASFPKCSAIGYSAFQGCPLQDIYFPVLDYLQEYAFRSCKLLQSVELPSVRSIGTGAFQFCSALKMVSIGRGYTNTPSIYNHIINANAFSGCINLSSFYICACSMYSIAGSTVFTNTPIWSGTGKIYVKASLVNAYKTASGWSEFASQIYAI